MGVRGKVPPWRRRRRAGYLECLELLASRRISRSGFGPLGARIRLVRRTWPSLGRSHHAGSAAGFRGLRVDSWRIGPVAVSGRAGRTGRRLRILGGVARGGGARLPQGRVVRRPLAEVPLEEVWWSPARSAGRKGPGPTADHEEE